MKMEIIYTTALWMNEGTEMELVVHNFGKHFNVIFVSLGVCLKGTL